MSDCDDSRDRTTAATGAARGRRSAWTASHIRLLTGAIAECRGVLTADADPHFVAHLHRLEQRLHELIVDADSPETGRPSR